MTMKENTRSTFISSVWHHIPQNKNCLSNIAKKPLIQIFLDAKRIRRMTRRLQKTDKTLTAFSIWKLQWMMMLAFPLSTFSISCGSRFHCKTPEVKYISMDKLTGMTLNGTVLNSIQAKDITECQRSCLHDEKCQSLNVNVSTAIGLTCDLLDINIYSNSSLLLQQSGSIHLFIPV